MVAGFTWQLNHLPRGAQSGTLLRTLDERFDVMPDVRRVRFLGGQRRLTRMLNNQLQRPAMPGARAQMLAGFQSGVSTRRIRLSILAARATPSAELTSTSSCSMFRVPS